MTCCEPKQPTLKGTFETCAPGSLPGGLTRTRFFDGMVLTQSDLENEQRFWRVKRRLTNRALGEGVVWGLRLRWDPKRRTFALAPGYALDCCGNDLVVECPIEASEAELIARGDPSLRYDATMFRAGTDVRRAREACVVLQYVECPEEARPVHLDPCTPPISRCEPSRIRETTRLLLVPPPMAPPPNCLDTWFDDLDDIKDSITDPKLRDALFPPAPTSPAPFTDPAALLPATLRVATPGTPLASGTNEVILQPPSNGTINGVTSSGTRTPSSLRAGIVQFELRPAAGWGFTSGAVKEGSVVVDEVAPPLDLQQFWALEITLPDGVEQVSREFEYTVAGLGFEQMFGDHVTGVAELRISGRVTVRPAGSGQILTVVEALRVDAKSNVGTRTDSRSCLDPWMLMANHDHARDDAKLLLLAAVYALFAEATARSGGAWTPARVVMAKLYVVAWHLLGVDLNAATDKQKLELAKVLAKLLQCWCDAMLYPGPRCSSEHHGVYLGCATIGPSGQILTFDMWEHRRQVLLGPVFNHWLGVFGIAPIDVIAARLGQAICCLSGLPLPMLPGSQGGGTDGKTDVPIGRGNVILARKPSGHPATAIDPTEMIRRMVGSFVAESSAPLARFRTQLANGTSIELMAPAATRPAVHDLDETVGTLLSTGAHRPRPLALAAARTAVAELAREISPVALHELSPHAAELAKSLADSGLTLAALIEAGPEGLIATSPHADPAAIDDLAVRAEAVLGQLAESVSGVVAKSKPGRPSATLREAAVRKSLSSELPKRFEGLTKARIEAALDRAATRST